MTFSSTRTGLLRSGHCGKEFSSRDKDGPCMTEVRPSAGYYTSSKIGATDSILNNISGMGSAASSRANSANRVAVSPRQNRKSSFLSLDDKTNAGNFGYYYNQDIGCDEIDKATASNKKGDVIGLSSRGSSAGRPLPHGPGPLIPSKPKLNSGKRRSDSVAGKGPLRGDHALGSPAVNAHSYEFQRPRELPVAPLSRRKSNSLTSVRNSSNDFGDSKSNNSRSSTTNLHEMSSADKQSRAGVLDNIDLLKARKSFQITRSPSFDNIYSSSRAGRNGCCNGVTNMGSEKDKRSTLITQRYHRSMDDVRHESNQLMENRLPNGNDLQSPPNGELVSTRQAKRTAQLPSRPSINRRNSDALQYSTNQQEVRNKRFQRRLSQANDEDANNENEMLEKKMNSLNSVGLVGLRNLGNTCFMNSIIQCLSCTKQLRDYFNDENHERDINETLSPMKGKLAIAFGKLIKEIWSSANSRSVISPNHLRSQIQRYAPRFTGFSQQDSQEFLRFLLEGLHEDLNKIIRKENQQYIEQKDVSDHEKAVLSWQLYQKREKSLISDLFVGQLKSILTCTMCDKRSVTFDPFWDLSLPIPTKIKMVNRVTLYDCFNAFTQEETLDGDEKPTCEHCKKRRKCLKRFLIERFPRVLVIHLKRFSEVRYRTKLNTLVEFPSDLNLSKYAANSGGMKTEVLYRLYGVSNHSGGTYSGHYTAYCRHPFTSEWHVFSDSRFDKISPGRLVSAEAYVLFYELQIEKSNI